MPHLPLSHCASLVREHDYDRYLSTLFAPQEVREAWFALFAFNHEIATIPELVSEEMIGFMRFAWWREALDEIYAGGAVRKHPVAQALAAVVTEHSLPRVLFDVLMEAREARIGSKPFDDTTQWEGYFRATSSSLLMLAAAVAKVEITSAVDALGMAWAYCGTARGAVLAGEKENAAALAQAGAGQLKRMEKLPACFRPFAATVEFYLRRLKVGRKTGRDVAPFLILSLGWKHLLKKI
jgi:phytoene synthase